MFLVDREKLGRIGEDPSPKRMASTSVGSLAIGSGTQDARHNTDSSRSSRRTSRSSARCRRKPECPSAPPGTAGHKGYRDRRGTAARPIPLLSPLYEE